MYAPARIAAARRRGAGARRLVGGAVVGLGTTYVLTRKWDRRDRGAPVSVSLSPQLGGGAVATVSGKF